MGTDNFIERRILIGLITSTEYLQRVSGFLKLKYFEAPEAKRVASWCLQYYQKYEKSPGGHMRDLFYTRAESIFDEEQLKWFEILLLSLSEEYENTDGLNVDYLVDETESFCKRRAIAFLVDEIEGSIESGDVSGAETTLAKFSLPEQIIGNGIFPFAVSDERVASLFSQQEETLLSFPPALQRYMGAFFTRESFVSFMGPEKSGKSFWLMECAFRGLRKGGKVAFFQAGDMSENQMLQRIYSRQTKRPKWDIREGSPLIVLDCLRNQFDCCDREERVCDFGLFDGSLDILKGRRITKEEKLMALDKCPEYVPCVGCKGKDFSDFLGTTIFHRVEQMVPALDAHAVGKGIKKFQRRYGNRFYLSTYPNDTLTVAQIKNDLLVQEKNTGFVPDVLIIDYADLLVAPEISEERSRQNAIWKQLRALSQAWHCCLITATQADAASYDQTLLKRKNFSEDKRKYAHVTAMFGINVSDDERDTGLCRLNALVVRDANVNIKRNIYVAQDLSTARCCLDAFF